MASKPMADAGRQRFQQFVKQATNKVVLDVSYTLYTDMKDDQGFPALPDEKIIWTLVDYQKSPSVTLRHFMDASTFRVLAWDILLGRFARAWAPKDGEGQQARWPAYQDHKGTAHATSQNGKPEGRRLTMSLNPDPKRDYPWAIKIERGLGQVIGKGAVKLVQVQDTVQVQLGDLAMRSIAAEGLEFLQAQRALRVSTESLALM